MTFTVLAISPETDEIGFAQATSTPAVGERCTKVVHGHGVITYQRLGDYRLFELARTLLKTGYPPNKIVRDLVAEDEYAAYRQIAVINMTGKIAVYTGSANSSESWAGEVVGKNYVATGNTLVGPKVADAMSEAYLASEGEVFAERLLRSLEAGRDAGGQPDGQMSSGISIYNSYGPTLDLRVDVHPEPIGELQHLYEWYKPLIPLYAGFIRDPLSWPTLDSWDGLEKGGSPLIPQAGSGWTAADVEKRIATIHKAPTTIAGKSR